MNEREFTNKIKQDLNYGANRLNAQVSARLKQAREQAMEVFAAQNADAHAFSYAGHSEHSRHPIASRTWLPFALITLALLGALYWQHEVNHEENLDVALLTSDLPLNAFVDQNFQAWLDHSAQR